MIVFHGTSRPLDKFEAGFSFTPEGNHPNGGLGLWLTTIPTLAARFGGWVLAVEAPASSVFRMTVEDLRNLADAGNRQKDGGVEMHRAFGVGLRADGYDLLAVIEQDGSAPTVVSLLPDQCAIIERIAATDRSGIERFLALAEQSLIDRGIDLSVMEAQIRF